MDEGRRESPRAPFPIACHARAGTGSWSTVFLEDLSCTGFRMDWPIGFPLLEKVSIRFPGIESKTAEVRWREGQMVGCEFVKPISPYVFDHLLATNAPKSE